MGPREDTHTHTHMLPLTARGRIPWLCIRASRVSGVELPGCPRGEKSAFQRQRGESKQQKRVLGNICYFKPWDEMYGMCA